MAYFAVSFDAVFEHGDCAFNLAAKVDMYVPHFDIIPFVNRNDRIQ